jgi:hypothetical protein
MSPPSTCLPRPRQLLQIVVSTFAFHEDLRQSLDTAAAEKSARYFSAVYGEPQPTAAKSDLAGLQAVVQDLAEAQCRTGRISVSCRGPAAGRQGPANLVAQAASLRVGRLPVGPPRLTLGTSAVGQPAATSRWPLADTSKPPAGERAGWKPAQPAGWEPALQERDTPKTEMRPPD